jgi:6-phosphogluconolactonase
MTNVVVNSFESARELAQTAANRWCQQIAGTKNPFTVALSGGRIANDFFGAIVARADRNDGIRQAHFFWADERCVAPDHVDSNYRVACELLLEPLRIEPSHIHRIRGEDEPAKAAAAASEELLRVAAGGALGTARPTQNDAVGRAVPSAPRLPILDWIFLGMGEDGHVASLFPGAEPRPGIYYDVIGPKPPPRRITLSYDVLAAASKVWVLASGAGKEATLQQSFRPDGTPPLARVLRMRKGTEIFSDIKTKIP